MQKSHWWKTTNIYQIYPRSFLDSNGDGIGDLQGLISRLDYLSWLGVETLWVSPFYASPQRDFGYDISDYQAIAPEYGTMADAEALIAEVHKRGMKIVLDMVLNHTSDQHPWFLESASSREDARADWYIWRDGRGTGPPTNWASLPGPNGWQWSPQRQQWYFASFLPFQPDLNYHNPEVRAAMKEVLRFWLRKGVDGFRLDIFNAIIKDPEFRHNPFSLHYLPTHDGMKARFQNRVHTVNHPGNFGLAREIRAVVDEFPGRFLVGEVFGQHPTIRRFLGERQDGLNLIFLFDMLFFKFKPAFFWKRLNAYEKHYAPPYVPTFVLGNHDQKRSIERLDGDMERAKVLAVLQMTTRGVPVIYYGEEIGMRDADIPKDEAKDPLSRMYHWVPEWLRKRLPIALNRDVSRTPMQWEATVNAGFTSREARPWLPISKDISYRNVQTQSEQPDSLLNVYRQLLAVRKAWPALTQGKLELLPMSHHRDGVLTYQRTMDGQDVKVYVNFGVEPYTVSIPKGFEAIFLLKAEFVQPSGFAKALRAQFDGIAGPYKPYLIRMQPNGAVVLATERNPS